MMKRDCIWEYCVAALSLDLGGATIVKSLTEFGVTLIDSGTTQSLLPPGIMRKIQAHFQAHYCHLPLVCGPPGKTLFDDHCIEGDELPRGFPTFTWRFDNGVNVVVTPEVLSRAAPAPHLFRAKARVECSMVTPPPHKPPPPPLINLPPCPLMNPSPPTTPPTPPPRDL